MNKKLIYQFSLISFFVIALISIVCFYSLEKNNKEVAIHNAEVTANVIKNTLNSHIIDNNIHATNTFINSLSNMKNINKVWISRSESINKQFGINKKSIPLDNNDKKVLQTGKESYVFNNDLEKPTLRISIPYTQDWTNGINCAKCHNVSNGDILGTISLELNVNEIEDFEYRILIIALIVFFGLLFIYLIFRKNLNQYLEIFESLSSNLSLNIDGNFKKVAYPKNLSKDIVTLIDKLNCLITSLKDTSNDIDKKLKGFIGKESNHNDNSLENSKEIVSSLSALYQFKKEIEQDNTKEEIYNRLSEVLKNMFSLSSFTFLEIDTQKKKMEVVIEEGKSFYCKKNIEESPDLCRAVRTKNDVLSIDYHTSCIYFEEKEKFHYCLNSEITKDIQLVINFVLESEEEIEELKEKISFIKSYINEATPSIEVKLLLTALQESALRDGLTGLYNRKFIEEYIKRLVLQAKREEFNIGVLLLDMDHFKAVNDEYGHDIGDKVLKELSRILTETVRETDFVIRYGGEEFVILLINVDSEESALAIAEKIRKKVENNEIDVYAGAKLRKTVSVGLSMFPSDASLIDSVIKNADIALYEAKNKGRNQVIRFQSEQISSVDLF